MVNIIDTFKTWISQRVLFENIANPLTIYILQHWLPALLDWIFLESIKNIHFSSGISLKIYLKVHFECSLVVPKTRVWAFEWSLATHSNILYCQFWHAVTQKEALKTPFVDLEADLCSEQKLAKRITLQLFVMKNNVHL